MLDTASSQKLAKKATDEKQTIGKEELQESCKGCAYLAGAQDHQYFCQRERYVLSILFIGDFEQVRKNCGGIYPTEII